MKMYLKLVYSLLLICSMGCSGDGNPILAIDGDFSYPTQIGDRWEYKVTETLSNIDPPIAGARDSVGILNSVVEITESDTLVNGDIVYTFEERNTPGLDWTALYSNQPEGMFLHFGLISETLPKTGLEREMTAKAINSTSMTLPGPHMQARPFDRSRLLETALQVFAYPFEVGISWLFQEIRDPATILSRVEKRIVGAEAVQVEAGTFEAFKIQWLFIDKTGAVVTDWEQFDFVCDQGLIKRTLMIRNSPLLIADNRIHFGDRRVECELTNLHVQ